MLSPQLLELLRLWWHEGKRRVLCRLRAGCFRAGTLSNPFGLAKSTVLSMRLRKPHSRLRFCCYSAVGNIGDSGCMEE